MSKHIIKKKQLPIKQIRKLFSQLSQQLPEWLHSSRLFVTFVFDALNDITILLCYLILLGQTARLLVNERSYANTKVLMTKWVIFIFFQLIFSHVSKDHLQAYLIKSFFLLAVLGLVYPSNVSLDSIEISKTIFQKYFKGQQTLKESSSMNDSFIINNNSLVEKFLIIFLVHSLKGIKYLLSFVNCSHRRTIQTEIFQINSILNGGNSFQKVNNNQEDKNRTKNELNASINEIPKQTISHATIPQASVKTETKAPQISQKSGTEFNEMIEQELKNGTMQVTELEKHEAKEAQATQQKKNNQFARATFSPIKKQPTPLSQSTLVPQQTLKNQLSTFSKQIKYKKYQVSQYLPLFSTTDRSSANPSLPNKRCTYYREIEISYDVNSAVITLTSLEDMKVSYHSLEEILLLEELMIQFELEGNQQMMVRFKNKTEYDDFISSIDMYESNLQSK